MKFLTGYIVFTFAAFSLSAQQAIVSTIISTSPLAEFSAEWNKPEYEQCNTAADEKFMNTKEKEVIYIINLIRSNPRLFANTVLTKYPVLIGKEDMLNDKYYYQSLLNTLRKMEQQTLLYADEKCFTSAACHAQKSGVLGYTGHARSSNDCKAKKTLPGRMLRLWK